MLGEISLQEDPDEDVQKERDWGMFTNIVAESRSKLNYNFI